MSADPKEPDLAPEETDQAPREDLPEPAEKATPVGEEPGPGAATSSGETDERSEALRELEDRWRRALAEIDNLRKRHTRELERERVAERERTAAALLPIIDNLDLALAHAQADPDSIRQGVEAVRDQAVDTLARLGFPRYGEPGVPFDPSRHEVVGVVEDPDAEPGTVVEVVRPGYGDSGRQLRPVAVTVAKRE